ncbi:MAG: RNA polymerase sigma factor [Candidatus Kapabacteria bacterium]|jgi:RNA polymerase sigma-70 factor (ECF subfamily)|nr:RNA polymerase sigma factor [Candidatus Kapabacteria bacterium]
MNSDDGNNESLDVLFRRLCAGDETAFTAFYHRIRRPMMAYCLTVANNTDDANDLFQKAMMAMWEHRSKARHDNIMGWLFTVARNTARTTARRAERSIRIEDPNAVPAITDARLDEDERDLIRRTVHLLPTKDREVVYLRYFAEMSFDDIAALDGSTINAIKQRLHRAKHRLALALGPTFDDWKQT